MDDFLKEAIEIAKAQANIRTMSVDEITTFVQKVSEGLRKTAEGVLPVSEQKGQLIVTVEGKKSVKEKTVTCLECGKSFKILSKRHLAHHALTTEEYLEKWGLKKGTALVCKTLQRQRRKKMKDMKLWERRQKIENS
jgi:predicted transcriptional regulator